MAYREDVKYIEEMNPGVVKAVGDDWLNAKEAIKDALPRITGLVGTVEWRADAKDLYERRLKETIDLVEGLHDGFDKAGRAVKEYAEAQALAKARITDGIAAENALGKLIADIIAQHLLTQWDKDALRQWEFLRSPDHDFLLTKQREAIEKIRGEADTLWNRAIAKYDEAIRLESDARDDATTRINAAYRLLPDFLASSILSAEIIDATPGLPATTDPVYKYRIGPPTAFRVQSDNDFPFDPDASPTVGDYASWNKWGMMLRGAQVARPDLDDANAAYAHYREGTGRDMRIDYEEAYAEDESVRETVDEEIWRARQAAITFYKETGQTSFQITGDPVQASEHTHWYPTSTENWEKTLGDYTVYSSAEVVVDGDQITMKVKVNAEDVYNFNADDKDNATGISDNENGRFSTLGWAKEFRTYGELERTVTFDVEMPPSGQPWQESLTGGEGPDRNAPGEDRADGRTGTQPDPDSATNSNRLFGDDSS